MAYKIEDGKLVKENENFISISSPKTVLFEALKLQVSRSESAEARAAAEELRAKSWHDSAMTLADQRDAAYKRNSELEARIEALEAEVMQQHHIASACAAECDRLEAERGEMLESNRVLSEMLTSTWKERDDLRAMLEKIRSEALERFNAADRDHTTDSDTAAWLLDIAQELEQPQ